MVILCIRLLILLRFCCIVVGIFVRWLVGICLLVLVVFVCVGVDSRNCVSFCVSCGLGLFVIMYRLMSSSIGFFFGFVYVMGMFLFCRLLMLVGVSGNRLVLFVCIILEIFVEFGMYLMIFGLIVFVYLLKLGLMFCLLLLSSWLIVRKLCSLNVLFDVDWNMILFLYFGLVKFIYDVGGV